MESGRCNMKKGICWCVCALFEKIYVCLFPKKNCFFCGVHATISRAQKCACESHKRVPFFWGSLSLGGCVCVAIEGVSLFFCLVMPRHKMSSDDEEYVPSPSRKKKQSRKVYEEDSDVLYDSDQQPIRRGKKKKIVLSESENASDSDVATVSTPVNPAVVRTGGISWG